MAEALLRYRGGPRFEAMSAGASPVGVVHPFAEVVLREIHVPVKGLRSKPWKDFVGQPLDAVITLCDAARDKVCPEWPLPSDSGTLPVCVHWAIEDPLSVEVMGETQLLDEFRRARDEIRDCIEHLAIAPDDVLDDDAAFALLLDEISGEEEETLDDRLVTVAAFNNPSEAYLLKGRLETEGIECFVADENMTNIGLYNPLVGGMKIQIRESDLAKATAVLDPLRESPRYPSS
jgi:protein-tyrosine-phosphatase